MTCSDRSVPLHTSSPPSASIPPSLHCWETLLPPTSSSANARLRSLHSREGNRFLSSPATRSPPALHFHPAQSSRSNANQRNNPLLSAELSCNLSAPSSLPRFSRCSPAVSNGRAAGGVVLGTVGTPSALFWIGQTESVHCLYRMCSV